VHRRSSGTHHIETLHFALDGDRAARALGRNQSCKHDTGKVCGHSEQPGQGWQCARVTVAMLTSILLLLEQQHRGKDAVNLDLKVSIQLVDLHHD